MTTTLVRSNERWVTAGITLGELVHVRQRQTWHSKGIVFDITFEHGCVLIDAQKLVDLMQQARAALDGAHIEEGETA